MQAILRFALVVLLGTGCGGSDGDRNDDAGGRDAGTVTGGDDSTPQTPLPTEMVGVWSITTSGSIISGRSELELAADGRYTQATRIESDTCFFSYETGTVAVEGASMTLYARTLETSDSCDPSVMTTPADPPAPETYAWEVSYDAEWDVTYLRLDDGDGPVNWMKEE